MLLFIFDFFDSLCILIFFIRVVNLIQSFFEDVIGIRQFYGNFIIIKQFYSVLEC